jgi:hypothetical protein
MYDLIIVSKSDKEKYQRLTQQTINTCLSTSEGIKVNVIVVETSGKLFPYRNVNYNILYTEEFNYNRCLNFGIKKARYNIHMLANNDLIFKEGWASTGLIMQKNKVHSTCLLGQSTQGGYLPNKIYEGYEINREIAGWLIFITRDLFKRMGQLPESSRFWYSDDNYVERLKEMNVKHYLMTHARVEHLCSQTFNELDQETYWKYRQR